MDADRPCSIVRWETILEQAPNHEASQIANKWDAALPNKVQGDKGSVGQT